jgi:6-phosphofructokinase
VTSTVYDVTSAVLKNIETLGLDYLVAIGGDDTLSYAAELDRKGMKVIAVPKTMDNDVRNTEYCIGFSTAITRAMDAIDRQRTTVGSHERIGIFRVFGRDAGYTALYTAYVTAVRCCIPEYKVDLKHLIDLLIHDKRSNPSNYSLVILSEGAEWQGYTVKEYGEPDAFGHRKKMSVAEDLSDEIKRTTGEENCRQRSHLRPAVGQPRFGGSHGGIYLRWHGDGCVRRRQVGTDGRNQRRLLRDGSHS